MRREDVEQAFREAGFLLVETAAETGLFTDWKKNAGLVKRISVDGVERFEAGGKVRFTVPVRITYYESKKMPVPEGPTVGEGES